MAVTPTGAIYKTLTFDNVSSGTYGVHITGEAAYNAPERDVEMIEIPGRNGAFALDKGRFANLEVTYPASIAADDPTDFAQAISDFRNQLCSRTGYCRLTDDYNTGEYRMAIYKSGLEVTPAQLEAGEFDITFECKPQRFLTSGESKITVTSGDDVNNPTLFDARPLLEATGTGDIYVGGKQINISSDLIGQIKIARSKSKETTSATGTTARTTIQDEFVNNGDEIYFSHGEYKPKVKIILDRSAGDIQSATVSNITTPWELDGISVSSKKISVTLLADTATFSYNTSYGYMESAHIDITYNDNSTETVAIDHTLGYTPPDEISLYVAVLGASWPAGYTGRLIVQTGDVWADSTVPAAGNPCYIDLDIGEAYKISNGVVVSSNSAVTLPAEMPVLSPGNTNITFSNTITKLEIVPRWWKV